MFDPRRSRGTAFAAALLCAFFLAPAQPAQSQEKYPERPVRLIIPFAPGGQTDIMGRRFGAKATALLGQQVLVDNRSGAGGTVGSAEAARAKPDGYTLLLGTSSTHAINPTAMEKIPYDAVRDFAPIAVLGTVPMSIVIHPSVPAKDLRAFVAQVKSRPGQYSYGSTGVGGINHLGGELFKMKAGNLDIAHVPYKSSGLSLQDLMGGHVPMVIATLSSAMTAHRQQRVRILAVAAEARSRAAPEIPTVIEAGVPEMVAYTFNVVLAPAGTSAAIVARLNKTAQAIMADDAFVKDLVSLGVDPITGSTPEHAGEFIKRELARWAPVIKLALKPGA
ncbi:MAG: tripartite tricarboxylate transporter substrate binding protein [Betaproteobacteria bacterium]|nr:MAG: tripartite tricarboxylate transporter substrate binding protein [Betaproteobacteria bacterium]